MLMMVFPMVWLYLLRDRLDMDQPEIKSVEMSNLNGTSNGISKTNGTNGTNGLLKVKSVIINENTSNGEHENFLSNGK